jgi:hypothetical protein
VLSQRAAGVWTFWNSQPEGFPEGGRRSPRVFGGGDLRATAQEKSCPPAGVLARCPRVAPRHRHAIAPGTPPGCTPQSKLFRWSFPLCSERPPATLCQPCGLGSVRKLSRKCPNSRGVLSQRAADVHRCPKRSESGDLQRRVGTKNRKNSRSCAICVLWRLPPVLANVWFLFRVFL